MGVLRVDGLRALIDHAGEGWFVRPEDRALLVAPLDATARRDWLVVQESPRGLLTWMDLGAT